MRRAKDIRRIDGRDRFTNYIFKELKINIFMIMAKQNLKLKMRQTESAGFFALQFNLLWKNVKIHKISNEICKIICKNRGENIN